MFSDGGKGAESSGWSEGSQSSGPAQKGLNIVFLRLDMLLSFGQTCYLLSEVFGEFNRHFLDCLLLAMLSSE